MDIAKQIHRHLHGVATMHEIAQKGNIINMVKALQRWQCARLLTSYQDLYQHARYRAAFDFFVNDLYGPRDFSQRDDDIARLVPRLVKLMPHKALHTLCSALELNALSFELDFQLALKMFEQPLNRHNYRLAYQQCENHPARLQQIKLIEQLLKQLQDITRVTGLSTLLSMSRKPAELLGLAELHRFTADGYAAFKPINQDRQLINTIVERETALLYALYDNAQPNPLPELSIE